MDTTDYSTSVDRLVFGWNVQFLKIVIGNLSFLYGLLLYFVVVVWHFNAVMYSLFKKVRGENRRHRADLYEPTTALQEPITTKV